MPATIQTYVHLAGCECPICNPENGAVARENDPTRQATRLTNQQQALMRAAQRGGTATMTITQRGAWTPAKAPDQIGRIRAAAGLSPEPVKVPLIARSDGGVPVPDQVAYITARERQRLGAAALPAPAPTPTTRTAATSGWTPAPVIDLVARIQAQEAAKASAGRR